MTDDIKALRDALAAVDRRDWGDDSQQQNPTLRYIVACSPDRIARLLDALEAATRDAERYRWLRDEADAHEMPKVTAPHSRWLLIGHELDAAIDAAMAQAHQ
jgi:hypothetical protein